MSKEGLSHIQDSTGKLEGFVRAGSSSYWIVGKEVSGVRGPKNSQVQAWQRNPPGSRLLSLCGRKRGDFREEEVAGTQPRLPSSATIQGREPCCAQSKEIPHRIMEWLGKIFKDMESNYSKEN